MRPEDGTSSLTYVPNVYNTSRGSPLPDALLISMKLPPEVPEEDSYMSHKAQDEAERPPKQMFKYYFGGRFLDGKFKIGFDRILVLLSA